MYTVLYCYDAYCGWCYGFSPVIRHMAAEYASQLSVEVLSGGMIIHEQPPPISAMAEYIKKSYKMVEETTGVKFGEDYLWHIFNPDKSDWFPDSEKPAIALCVFKDSFPDQQVAFAADLQYALHFEGRDLCDDEAYRHLLEKYAIPAEIFYQKLHSAEYKRMAQEEFDLVKKLRVTGFPTLLLQHSESKFQLLARGYTDYETLQGRIDQALKQISHSANH
ncbi:MAG TPA: DsbA family protein [Puia sp.]|nr:DsbA family protein [Puia sp.]